MNDLTFTTQSQILHHGIQGQKWGVQNGPPYPLSRGTERSIKKELKLREKAKQQELLYKAYKGEIPYSQVKQYMDSSSSNEFKKQAKDIAKKLAVATVTAVGAYEIQRLVNRGYDKFDNRPQPSKTYVNINAGGGKKK